MHVCVIYCVVCVYMFGVVCISIDMCMWAWYSLCVCICMYMYVCVHWYYVDACVVYVCCMV